MLPNYPPDIDKSNVVKVAKQLLKDREYLMDLPGNDMNLLFTTKTMLDVIEMLRQKCKDLKAENEKLDAELEENEKHLKMLAKRNANSKKLELEVRVERLESAVFGTRKEKERNAVPEQKKYDNSRSNNRFSSKADISGNGSYGNYEHPNKLKIHREPTIQDTSAMNESRRRNVNKPQKMDESQRTERSINQGKSNDDTVLEIIDDPVHMSDLQNSSAFIQTFVAVEKPAGDHARQQVEKHVKLNDLQNSRGVQPSYATEKPSNRVSTRQELPAPKEKADNTFDNVFRHPSTSFSSFANSSTSQSGSFRYSQTPANRSDSSACVSVPLTPSSNVKEKRRVTNDVSFAKPPPEIDYSKLTPRIHGKLDKDMDFCQKLLKTLSSSQFCKEFNWPFLEPLDAVALNIPDYYDVIKKPMDLSTMQKKMAARQYATAEEVYDDFMLMCNNCFLYNSDGQPVNIAGKQMKEYFLNRWSDMPKNQRSTPRNN